MEIFDGSDILDPDYSSIVIELPRIIIHDLMPYAEYDDIITNYWPDSPGSIDGSIIQDANSLVYNQTSTNIVCSLVFPTFKFFVFALLERVSSHFLDPVKYHLEENYLNKKRELFENFNLEKFLMCVDRKLDTDVPEEPKPITLYELNFIFKHFGFMMREIKIQIEFIKTKKELFKASDFYKMMKFISAIVKVFIDAKYHSKLEITAFGNNIKKYVYEGSMINAQYDISSEDLALKIGNRNSLRKLRLLTNYSHIERNILIGDYLRNIKIYELDIKGAEGSSNRNCDDIIEAITVLSLYSLENIIINSCHSENLFGMLKKFNNLRDVAIHNLVFYGSYSIADLFIPKLLIISLLNCPFIDDLFCYELIKQNHNLEVLRIYNCDNVNGLFLAEIKKFSRTKPLRIFLTHLRKEFLDFNIDTEDINSSISLITSDFLSNYDKDQMNNLLNEIYDEIDYTDNYELNETMSQNKVPYGFGRMLREYFRSRKNNFQLDLCDYNNLDKNCLKYLSTLSRVDSLSLMSYYPKVSKETLVQFLKEFKPNHLFISGYNFEDYADVRNSCDHILQVVCFDSVRSLNLTNVHGLSRITTLKLKDLKMYEIKIENCPELNDEMCEEILNLFGELKEFHISRCSNITGSFLNQIGKKWDTWITIDDSPGLIDYSGKEIQRNHQVKFTFCLTDDGAVKGNDSQYIFDNKFFTKLFQWRFLWRLTVATFYPNVKILQDLCLIDNIEELLLINDTIPEYDATDDILFNFATRNPQSIITLSLQRCRITKRGIASINRLSSLYTLSFDSVVGLNNELIKQLPFAKLEIIEICNNDELDDATFYEIVKSLRYRLNVAKCGKITKNIFDYLKDIYKSIILDLSGTEAGYFWLRNPSFQFVDEFKQKIDIEIFSFGANLDYLCRICNEVEPERLTKLPETLIKSFSHRDSLDLSEFDELNDEDFELISQLDELGSLNIRDSYKNVSDHRRMLGSLSKLALHNLIIEGFSDYEESSNCDDILSAFADNTKNSLEEISIINCQITREVIETLCRFDELSVVRISNVSSELNGMEIMKEFQLNDRTLHALYVNDRIIDDG